MKQKILAIFKYILFLSIGFGILFLLVKDQGAAEIKQIYKVELKSNPALHAKYQEYPELQKLSSELQTLHLSIETASDKEAIMDQSVQVEEAINDYFSLWEQFKLGLAKINKDLGHANYVWILFSLLFAVISHWIRAMRWKLLIQPLGYEPRTLNTFFGVMIGYVANLVVPRMGEVSRCAALGKSEKIPVDKLLGTVIVERAVDLISLLSLTALAFILEIDVILEFFSVVGGDEKLLTASYVMLFLGIIAVLFLGIKYGPKIMLNLLSKTSIYYKVIKILAGLRSGLKSIANLKSKKTFIIQTVLIWLCYFLMIYMAFPSYEPTSHLGPQSGLTALVIGSFGMVAPVQGGIGAYHWCLQKCLELYQIPSENGLTLAFIVHTAQTLLVIVLGVLSIVLMPLFSKKKKENG